MFFKKAIYVLFAFFILYGGYVIFVLSKSSTEALISYYLYGKKTVPQVIFYHYIESQDLEELEENQVKKDFSLLRTAITLTDLDRTQGKKRLLSLIDLFIKKGASLANLSEDGCNYVDKLIMGADVILMKELVLRGIKINSPWADTKCNKDLFLLLNDFSFKYSEKELAQMTDLIKSAGQEE